MTIQLEITVPYYQTVLQTRKKVYCLSPYQMIHSPHHPHSLNFEKYDWNIKKLLVAHLNINSLKFKFVEIHEVLSDKIVDILFISETKIDSSYLDSIFTISGYKFERDRDIHGGGLASFVRADITSRRQKDLRQIKLKI